MTSNHGTFQSDGLDISGNHNTFRGNRCRITGNHNVVYGDYCFVTGNHNKIFGLNCKVNGNHNQSVRGTQVTGSFNRTFGSSDNHNQSVRGTQVTGSFDRTFGSSESSDEDSIGDMIANVFGSVGSISYSGQQFIGGVGQMSFAFGGKTLVLLNIPQLQTVDATTTISWESKRLVYRGGKMTCNGNDVHVERLLSAYPEQRVSLDWSEFCANLDQLQKQVFQGQDEPTEEESKACAICLENVKCCAVMPCGHVCLCIGCANEFDQRNCPICREPMQRLNRIFI